MSLVFRPRQFRDKNGDLIEIGEMKVTYLFGALDGIVRLEFDNDDKSQIRVLGLDDIQYAVEEKWDEGRITKGRNVTKSLRDHIQITECVKSAQIEKWSHYNEEELQGLKEKLRRLSEEK